MLRHSKAARLIVFVKFIIWDFPFKPITIKECWVIAGINTIMPKLKRN
jgi:hypothetical protein